MPSTSYRRKLRNPYSTSIRYITNPTDSTNSTTITTILTPYITYKSDCESDLIKTQNYFYKILDMIIHHNDFTIIISNLHHIIDSTQSIVDYYRILEIIETNLLSVVFNISENISPGIIQTRIDYIRSYISKLPPGCVELSPISDMILQVINYIIKSVDFSIVITNINNIQDSLHQKYGEMMYINNIHHNILSIICNISENTNSAIISERVKYLREIISEFRLFSKS